MSGIILKELSDEMLMELLKEIIAEQIQRAFNAGYEKGFAHKPRQSEIMAESIRDAIDKVEKSQQQYRDEIVEQAKRDIAELKEWDGLYPTSDKQFINPHMCHANFIVNKNKRTVVCLLRGIKTGKVRAKGIAKCAPNDCFNVHIGKAIALRRALGLEVPNEYLNAPQPTEIRVGDRVYGEDILGRSYEVKVGSEEVRDYFNERMLLRLNNIKIIDDSREGVAE